MRFWKKKEEPKEKPKRFEPCLDTLLWLWKEEIAQEQIREIIEEGDYDAELCPVCKDNWVYDGQWYHYVKRDILYKAYERVHEYLDLGYAIEGLTDECCEGCYYEDGHAGNMNELEDYILEIRNEDEIFYE